MGKRKVAFFGDDPQKLAAVFDSARRDRIAEIADLHARVVSTGGFEAEAASLAGVEAIFATWGMPRLSSRQVALLPRLEAVFYAAGSVQAFARPFLERGIKVASAWEANAVPVAEFALSQIILSCKGYFRDTHALKENHGGAGFSGPGCYGETVALLGAGRVARRLIELLRPIELRVLVYDPFLDEIEAKRLGVGKVSLEEAFARGYVVSNHVPNLPQTVGMLDGRLFRLMRPHATFVNTGRGATVVETDLIEALQQRPDLSALLDVTWPEPPAPDSPLYRLANVWLSSHIAGSKGDEVHRMADSMIDEYRRWEAGLPLEHQVRLEELDRLA